MHGFCLNLGPRSWSLGRLTILGFAALGLTANPSAKSAEPAIKPNAGVEAGAMSEPRYLLFWRAPEQALELVRQLGSKGDSRSRLLGFGVPMSAFDEEKQLPTRIHTAFATARAHDLAVMLSFDFHILWRSRPDLWNWFDTNQPGYKAANRRNVEWFGWDGPPAKTRYLNWGVAERIAPPPCLTSAAYRSEVRRLVQDVIVPPLKEELAVLEREGKGHLFAGVLVGAEPGIDDWSNPDPQTAKLMAEDDVPHGRLGYRALLDRGYTQEKPPADLQEALAEVVQETIGFWCRQFAEAGVPQKRLYPHVAPQMPDMSSSPVSAAFNAWSRPGWTTYPVGLLAAGFGALYGELQKRGNPLGAGSKPTPALPAERWTGKPTSAGTTTTGRRWWRSTPARPARNCPTCWKRAPSARRRWPLTASFWREIPYEKSRLPTPRSCACSARWCRCRRGLGPGRRRAAIRGRLAVMSRKGLGRFCKPAS